MNHIMFFPAFDQLAALSAGKIMASPAGEESDGCFCVDRAPANQTSVTRPGSSPLVFQGRLLIDETFGDHELKLYEVAEDDFVCLFGAASLSGVPSLRLIGAGSAEDIRTALNALDPLRMIDANVPSEISACESLHIFQERLGAARTALTSLGCILNVDVSDAIARLAALCDGEQTWLQ
jgi:hypothetical protein